MKFLNIWTQLFLYLVLTNQNEKIEKILIENKNNYECFVANDNSNGQLVVSGRIEDIDKFINANKIALEKLNT